MFFLFFFYLFIYLLQYGARRIEQADIPYPNSSRYHNQWSQFCWQVLWYERHISINHNLPRAAGNVSKLRHGKLVAFDSILQ